MYRKIIQTLLIVILCGNAFGQTVKFRVGANTGKFLNELGSAEVEHPLVGVLSNPEATEFTSNFKSGFEAELIMPISTNLEAGFEMEFANFSGFNDLPPYYNYYFAPNNPNVITTTQPLIYETSTTNFILNFRYNVMPEGNFNPFFKVFGGMSLIGTELNYKDPEYIINNNLGVLYAVGTENTDDPKESGFYYGGGIGATYKISDKLAIYVDGTLAAISSGIINGIPNYDYENTGGQETLKPIDAKSMTAQISIGLLYITNKDTRLVKGGGGSKSGSRKKGGGRTTPWRPFYRQK